MSYHKFDHSTEAATSGTRTLADVMSITPGAGDIDLTPPERTCVARPAVVDAMRVALIDAMGEFGT